MTGRLLLGIGIWIGVVIGAYVAIVGNDAKWQWDAYNHQAAVWKREADKKELKWQWMDEYYREQLKNTRFTPHPTPAPYWQRL